LLGSLELFFYSLSMICKHVRELGFVSGIRYFFLLRKIAFARDRNPEVLEKWASCCNRLAARMEFFDPSSQHASDLRALSKVFLAGASTPSDTSTSARL